MLYIIPLQVRAFYASQATQVLGQDIVFENIPWYNIEQQTFVRSLTPFISNSIIPSAFSNEHLITLEKGLHLHWHIPKPLKLFSQDTNLPKVPTRWYVSKKQNGVIKDEWIIESDYLWDINNPALKTSRHSTYPIPESGDVKEGFEFRYIGRTLKLNAWLNEQINNGSNDYLGELTALGWGTLNFDLHYANCRSVFGFHDPDYQINQPCTYEITGFYANHEQDFLQTLIRNNRNELIQRISKLDLDKLENDEVIRQGVIDNEQSTNQQIDTFDISNIAKSFSPKFNTAKINKYKDRLSKSVRVHSTMTLVDRIQKINEISNNLSLEVLEVEINKSYIYDVEHAYKYFLDHNNFFADEYNRNYSYTSTVAGCPITQIASTDVHASSDQNIHTILAAKLSLNTEDFVGQIETSSSTSIPIKISVAETLPDALTSILLREVTDPIQKLTKEEQIESLLNFSDLEDKNLDWISRLRNLRHTNQFRKMDAVHKWEFKAINNDTEELNPNVNLQDKLDLLNNLQQKFDLARFDLYRSIENLYLDWNYYVDYLFRSSHYNVKLDSNRIQSILRNKSIPQVKSKQLYVARYNSSINQLKQDIESIALDQGLRVHSTIATSYYESLSPTVILYADNNNDISSELKNILDHKKNSSIQTIICVENIDWSISTDPNILINRLKNTNIIDLFPTIQHPADWYSYKIEWEANFLNNRGKKSNDVYDPDYLMQKYVVDNQLPDLKKHPENFQHNYAADNNIYFGQSHIHTGIADLYKEKLASLLNSEQTSIDHLSRNDNSSYSDVREFVTELTNQVDRLSLLEITLNDFNNTFMQRSSALSIMALIPNGFLPHQELAKEINSLFNEFEADVELLNPNPYSHFSPIKDGAFRINKLRIVDTFGRSKLAHVQQTHTTQQLQIQNKANWLALPPRLAQPACIHADWIDSNNIDSPVFGWFMINLIDLRLECYEYDGKHIGSFISNGNWEFSPFQKHLASQTFDSEFSFLNHNRDLQQVLKWFNSQMINSDRLSFFKTLFEQITLSLSYIEPENYENPTLMESITTTPLALTKVSINLFVKGGPLHDLNKENFKDFIEGNQQRNCSEYDAIKFPISIGDYTQYHNSCVGYWHIQQLQDYPASNCCLYFNNPEFVTLYSERILDTHNKYAELMRLDLLYRNDKSDHISIFLEKLRLTDRGNKICKTDFLDAYIIEGERIWNLLMEMRVIVGTSLTSMLTSLSNNQYQGNEIHGLKLKQIDDNAYLTINKNLRERSLFMILHPKGKLHIKSGILPQHEIQLPYSKIKHALNRLELTLYAGPVLTPKNQLEISLTKDKSYLWSWINIQKPPYPYRNRITQLRSLDLYKVDLPISITDLEELIQRLKTSRLILTTKPTKSQHEHIYIVNPNYSFASQLQLTEERTIQEFLMQKSHKTFLHSFEQHFHHDNRIYEFHSAFDLEKFKRLFENGFIEYFPLFVNKKYVLLTEFGYTVKNNNNLFIQLNLLDQEDLSSLRPCSESHYELRSADLVEINSELLNQLNVQLVKKRYLKSSLLKHDDFYKSEDIYFIIEESFNLTEQLVANIALYKDLKLQLLGKPLSTITIEVAKIWNNLKALKNLHPLIHPISTMNVQLQVIDKIQSFIIHDNVVQMIQELTQIEDLLLQHTSDANREFMRIQQTIEKLTKVEITSQSFDNQWASNVEVFNLINNNIRAISTIQDFNYSNVHIPTTVLKEGWLSIKTSLNQL